MNLVILLLFLLVFFGHAYAASIKEVYELQEQCGKRAEEVYKHEYGNGTNKTYESTMGTGYRNHYNTRLNKCFVLFHTLNIPKNEGGYFIFSVQLRDINENKIYGIYSHSYKYQKNYPYKERECRVLDKVCHSEAEWDTLIKPYMEE